MSDFWSKMSGKKITDPTEPFTGYLVSVEEGSTKNGRGKFTLNIGGRFIDFVEDDEGGYYNQKTLERILLTLDPEADNLGALQKCIGDKGKQVGIQMKVDDNNYLKIAKVFPVADLEKIKTGHELKRQTALSDSGVDEELPF